MNNKQIKYLKGLAQKMNPSVIVGKAQVTDPVVEELRKGLAAHELVKVKFAEPDREDFLQLAEDLREKACASKIQIIGRMAIYYRQHPDVAKRKIRLPS